MIIFFVLISVLALVFIFLLIIPLLVARFLMSLIFLILVVPLLAVLMYWYLGGTALIQELIHKQDQAVEVQAAMSQFSSPAQVIEAMKRKLAINPTDAKGWYLLGKLYLNQQDYQNAAKALKEANELNPNQLELMLSYAQALFFLNSQSLNPQISQLLSQVLAIDPDNIEALSLFALGAYQAKEYEVAINYWQRLSVLLPDASDEQKAVFKMIEKAHKLADQPSLSILNTSATNR